MDVEAEESPFTGFFLMRQTGNIGHHDGAVQKVIEGDKPFHLRVFFGALHMGKGSWLICKEL